MKILYIISTFKGGNGGHAYSLKHISSEIANYADVSIISIGPKRSKVVTTSPHYLEYIYFNGIGILSLKKKLDKILESYQPDIIHCFDTNAYNVIKLLVPASKNKFVLTKPGGPNKADFPVCENLTLFSEENRRWFAVRKRYNNTNIYLIPNRVKRIQITDSKIASTIQKDAAEFTFVRIARLGEAYKKGVLDAINLIRILTDSNYRVRLYVIGIIESEKVVNEIREAAGSLNVTFLTDDDYTVGASKMLYLADAVVATGRGLMEATSLGIPILTPSKSANFPVLVTEKNFIRFLATNFSERNFDQDYDEPVNLSAIKMLISDKEFYQKASSFSSSNFNAYFDIEEGARQYIQVYNKALKGNTKVGKFKDLSLKLRTLYGFYKYSRIK